MVGCLGKFTTNQLGCTDKGRPSRKLAVRKVGCLRKYSAQSLCPRNLTSGNLVVRKKLAIKLWCSKKVHRPEFWLSIKVHCWGTGRRKSSVSNKVSCSRNLPSRSLSSGKLVVQKSLLSRRVGRLEKFSVQKSYLSGDTGHPAKLFVWKVGCPEDIAV